MHLLVASSGYSCDFHLVVPRQTPTDCVGGSQAQNYSVHTWTPNLPTLECPTHDNLIGPKGYK